MFLNILEFLNSLFIFKNTIYLRKYTLQVNYYTILHIYLFTTHSYDSRYPFTHNTITGFIDSNQNQSVKGFIQIRLFHLPYNLLALNRHTYTTCRQIIFKKYISERHILIFEFKQPKNFNKFFP